MPKPSLTYCASLVRTHDHDRYLCTLFAPAPVREAWFALFAFNHELATIAEIASEEMIGFMRFAWWREVLDEIYNGSAVRRHPVAGALAQAVVTYRLSRGPMDALLDAREERLTGAPFAGLPEWEAYFRATSSGLLELCALVAGAQPAAAIDELGIAWGCIGTARMQENSLLMKAAKEHLQGLREGLPEVFNPFRDTAEFYLKQLERGKRAEGSFMLPFTLCWQHFSRRF